MSWWDTSALISLLAQQQATEALREVHSADEDPTVWWGTRVEGTCAIARLRRRGVLRPDGAAQLLTQLEERLAEADEIGPSDDVRDAACRAARVHDLSAADALQLAAALEWAEQRPTGKAFVCLDHRLREAAALQGFRVLPEGG